MISNLPKYYRIAAINPVTEEIIKKRSEAIESIIATKELPWLLDCIRLFIQKPIKNKEFEHELFLAFNEFDTMFLEEDSSLERRILAGAIVGECVAKREDKVIIAFALKSSIFGVAKESIVNYDIIFDASSFLEEEAIRVRENESTLSVLPKLPVIKEDPSTIETLTPHVKALLAYIKVMQSNNEQQIKNFNEKISILDEESNIHWWLFRSYSQSVERAVSQLEPIEALFFLTYELHKLIKLLPPPPNTDAFLAKMLNDVDNKPEEVAIQEVIDNWYKGVQNFPENQEKQDLYGNLLPITNAFTKITESDGEASWITPFEKNTGIKAEFKCKPLELCSQLLDELILFDL